jgi:hypothetical protein
MRCHIRQTLFIDGGNCGTLTMRTTEYHMFGTVLKQGAKQLPEQTAPSIEIDKIGWNSEGEFAKPGTPECVRTE